MRRGVDDRGVRKGLREIAEEPPRLRVVSFRHEAEIVPAREQALEPGNRVVAPPDQGKAVGQPETAGQEHPLVRRQPIRLWPGRIAADEAVAHQLALDRRDRATDPRIVGRQEPQLWDQQERGIEIARAVILDEGVALAVIGPVEDLLGDLAPHLVPMLARPVEPELLDRFDAAVESDPGHDFREGELAWWAADLPDALVRLLPDRLQIFEKLLLQRPGKAVAFEPI